MTSKIRKYVASAEAIYDIALGCIEENSNELHICGRFFHIVIKPNGGDQDE